MIKTKREMNKAFVDYVQRYTHMMRRNVVHDHARTQKEYNQMQSRKRKKFLVCGRIDSGRVIWDVYSLLGTEKPKLVAGGFAWQEEAISFARDRSLGRSAVSFNGVRCVLGSGKGRIMAPDKSLELPGQNVVKVTQTKKGVVVG